MEFPREMYGIVGMLKLVQYSFTVGALITLSSIPKRRLRLSQYLILLQLLALPFLSIMMIIILKYELLSSTIVGLQIANVIGCAIWTVSAFSVIIYNCIYITPVFFNLETILLLILIAVTVLVFIEVCLFSYIISSRRTILKKRKLESLSDPIYTFHSMDFILRQDPTTSRLRVISNIAVSDSVEIRPSVTESKVKSVEETSHVLSKDKQENDPSPTYDNFARDVSNSPELDPGSSDEKSKKYENVASEIVSEILIQTIDIINDALNET